MADKVLWALEEAGAEEIQTLKATFTEIPRPELEAVIRHMVRQELVYIEGSLSEGRSEVVLTEAGRRALASSASVPFGTQNCQHPTMGSDHYGVFSTRGGGEVVTAARALLKELDALLATAPGARLDALLAMRREVAVLEADPHQVRTTRSLGAARLVKSWPKDDALRQQVEHLNFLLQRPLS